GTGMRQVVPQLRETDQNMPPRPWIDQFSSGYMKRVLHLFPKQGDREPWINPQNYARDKKMIRFGRLQDGALVFGNGASCAPSALWGCPAILKSCSAKRCSCAQS